jgi:hypothetical protein
VRALMGDTMLLKSRLASRIAQTGRPGQRHAQGSSYADLTVETKLDPEDPPYDPDRE